MPDHIISDREFGDVIVRVNARALRYIFRVKKGALYITVPYGATDKNIAEVIEVKRAEIRNKMWLAGEESDLNIGDVIETQCFTILINSYNGKDVLYTLENGALRVFVPQYEDMTQSAFRKRVKEGIMKFVRRAAEPYLKNRLDLLARRIGLSYKKFTLSYGRARLGKCDTYRNITLSCYLVFYPANLTDYVIMHELAHLTEMNHGAGFHKLCDSYCSGNEKELRLALRKFRLPL